MCWPLILVTSLLCLLISELSALGTRVASPSRAPPSLPSHSPSPTVNNILFAMLRRQPTTLDGKVVDRLQESDRINKPFKPPTLKVQREQPQRKRKRVSYKGADAGDDSSDSDDGAGRKSKKKKSGKDGDFEGPRDNNIRAFPVFKAKPFADGGLVNPKAGSGTWGAQKEAIEPTSLEKNR